MIRKIDELKEKIRNDLSDLKDNHTLEEFRVRFLGRKGHITELFKQIKDVEPQIRKEFGQKLNELKNWADAELNNKKGQLTGTAHGKVKQLKGTAHGKASARGNLTVKGDLTAIDLTLPAYRIPIGKLHPLTQTFNDITKIFMNLGFTVADGPEIETDYYNFEALNLPKDHPARNMQDTLYIEDEVVLRTHTSPVQIRVMEKQKPPVQIIAPGRVYRRDTPDASHSPFFHQVEGLVVDKNISFRDLKGVIEAFAVKMFGKDIHVRFRPSFFPFTEPSLEYDFNCVFCRGKGCKVCQNTGWLEISGAGMVDPNVYGFVDYDPEVYSGYAFGMGIDRIAMLRYGINDIRLLFDNDLRFLAQF